MTSSARSASKEAFASRTVIFKDALISVNPDAAWLIRRHVTWPFVRIGG